MATRVLVHGRWIIRLQLVAIAITTPIAVLTVRSAPALADPLFSAAFLSFDASPAPYSIAVADLNRDGIPDLIAPGEMLSVLLGCGRGSFAAHRDYPIGVGAYSVAVGDLNGDGIPDVATANHGAYPDYLGTVSVLLGRGDGTFATHTDYGVGIGTASVAIGDLNGDGRPDLVAANAGNYPYGNTVAVLLGHGDGTFGPGTNYLTGLAPISVAIADLNGDGRLDLAVASAVSSTVSVLLGRGDGTFAAVTDVGYGAGPVPVCVAIGDLNGDGALDLVTSNLSGTSPMYGGSLSVLLGHGDGTFETATSYAAGTAPRSVAIGDLNGDDRPDLIVTSGASIAAIGSTVSVLIGLGDGTFGPRADFATNDDACAVAIADLNGDGMLDVAVANPASYPYYQNALSVLFGNGDGTLGVHFEAGPPKPSQAVAIGDLNGDGTPDLVTIDIVTSPGEPSPISVLSGNGKGGFAPIADYSTGGNCVSVAIGDLNGDGLPDLAAANQDFVGTIGVLLGKADGTFRSAGSSPAGWLPASVAIGDLNADGRPDLVVGDGNAVSVLPGNGDGTFGPRMEYGTRGHWSRVLIADLNVDGRRDLLVLEWKWPAVCGGDCPPESSMIAVWIGRGDGTFEEPTATYPLGPTVLSSATVGDLNGDGKPDVAVAREELHELTVLMGKGDGTLGTETEYETAGPPRSVAIGDVNEDGELDLVTGNGRTASVWLGKGDGTFAARTDYGIGTHDLCAVIGDVNRDGKPDLVTTGNPVCVLLNIGPGAPPLTASADLDPSVVNLGDHAPWLAAYIEPSGFDAASIDLSTLRLAGSVSASPKFSVLGDHNGDGTLDLGVKFDLEMLDPLLKPGVNELAVTGSLVTGRNFEGRAVVRVIGTRVGAHSVASFPSNENPLVATRPLAAWPLPYRGGSLNVAFSLGMGTNAQVAVFDLSGRLVRVLPGVARNGAGSLQWDGRDAHGISVGNGVYFLRAVSKNQSAQLRFVVLR